MILFLSGIASAKYLLAPGLFPRKLDVLVSYVDRWFPDREAVGQVFLDSGAFSVFLGTATIPLADYIAYCHTHRAQYDYAAALDVIGDWQQSKQNYLDMTADGLDVIPTYHIGEPMEFLGWLLERYSLVGIGGMVPYIHRNARHVYWKQITRHLGHIHKMAREAGVKLHGFGVTGWDLMSGYPWFSVDSTSWVAGRRFGRAIYIKRGMFVGDKDYDRAARFSRQLGLNYTAAELRPKRTPDKERYPSHCFPINHYNTSVYLYATDLITKYYEGEADADSNSDSERRDGQHDAGLPLEA